MSVVEIRHAHLFCGLGGGAKGFNDANPRVGAMRGKFRCLGGIDVDRAAIRDFERLTGARGTVMDLFSREQYRAFHGQEPPEVWREAGTADIHAAFGHERPHIVFLSAPCKGFSGLLSQSKSQSARYQALNELTLRGIWLTLEAYGDDPPELLVFENVPRIITRGRHLLDQITALLRYYGYAVAETTHDCGRLGGLAQSRKRFLLVARHKAKVPSFLYQPDAKPLRAVGDVLGRMPLPGDPAGGAMHRIPALQWKTWVRLAFVEAGSDWRSLNRLAVENGFLRDYGIVPEGGDAAWRDDVLGVVPWKNSLGTVTGKSSPTNGRFAVADPLQRGQSYGKYAVTPYDAPSGTVIAGSTTGQGCFAVADTRCAGVRHANVYRIVSWTDAAGCITAGCGPSAGGQAVADVRTGWGISAHQNLYRIVSWDGHAQTITGAAHPAGGALSVGDPRLGAGCRKMDYGVRMWGEACGTVSAAAAHDNGYFSVADVRCAGWNIERTGYSRAGVYGVVRWNTPCGPVTAKGRHDNSACAVADIRLPEASQNCVAIIRALDGTWHRPFTTLELAALQGLLEPEETLELDGLSDSAWRERIGNAVPPPAARAVAEIMGQVLLLTWAGETFTMSQSPIWVRPIAAALMSARGETEVAAS